MAAHTLELTLPPRARIGRPRADRAVRRAQARSRRRRRSRRCGCSSPRWSPTPSATARTASRSSSTRTGTPRSASRSATTAKASRRTPRDGRARRARRLRPLPRRPARRPLGRGDRRRHHRLVRGAAPLKSASGSVPRRARDGPTSWKVTEVADLRGDRTAHAPRRAGHRHRAGARRDCSHRLRHHGHPVTLDLAEVTFMDSTGLTTLMDAQVQAERNGWSFAVTPPVTRGPARVRARGHAAPPRQ